MVVNALFITFASHAQHPSTTPVGDLLEDIVVNNDMNGLVDKPSFEEELEALASLRRAPLNLNTATREELERFPFLSDLQIERLLAYVYLHGPMVTLHELQLVEEMDRRTIDLLLPFVRVAPAGDTAPFRWKELLKNTAKHGKHEATTRLDIPLYRRKGYEQAYLGSPVYNSARYAFHYSDRVYASLVAEKDAGEPFAARHNRKGYDHYSFSLLLRQCGRLKALAAGNYRMSFGQGLVLSTDYLMGGHLYATSLSARAGGIKKHSSTDEYNYFRGLAATVSLGTRWEASAFYSRRRMDGTLEGDRLTAIYTTGLHRSEKEAGKRGAFALTLAGGNVAYRQNRLKLGVTAIYYTFGRAYAPKLSGYSLYDMHGGKFYNVGLDYAYRLGRFAFQGETAKGLRGWASLNRLHYTPAQGTTLTLIHRYYAYDYWAMFARSFAQGSATRNERGWYVGVDTSPLRHWNFLASLDLFAFPWKKYRVSKPSNGMDGMAQATFTPRQGLTMQLRYRYRRKERDLTADDAKLTLPTHQHQLRYRLTYSPCALLGSRTTADYNQFGQPTRRTSRGYQLSELITLTFASLHLAADLQGSYFHTDGYDSRVYLSEPGLLYTFSAPMLQGRGFRLSTRLRYEPGARWTLLAKLGHTIYSDRTEIGSGNDLIAGNTKGDVQLQIRFRF
jgi:hypothetical protein